jgi:hypothetical protein
MSILRRVSEQLARKTSRRGLVGKGADVAFGTLIGAAAGTAIRPEAAIAGAGTVCAFPGPPCTCTNCLENATCAKPCVINTTWYSGGCWVTGTVTCCDCTCGDIGGRGFCGCGTDYHLNTANCPDGVGGS